MSWVAYRRGYDAASSALVEEGLTHGRDPKALARACLASDARPSADLDPSSPSVLAYLGASGLYGRALAAALARYDRGYLDRMREELIELE